MPHAVTISFNAPLDFETEDEVYEWIAANIPLPNILDTEIEVQPFDQEE